MRRRFATLSLAIFILGLQTLGSLAQERSVQPQSTTEVFALRERCHAMADKLSAGLAYGEYWTRNIRSNYSLKFSHCYVVLEDSTADISAKRQKRGVTLYDGLTGELLAAADTDGDKQTGQIFDEDWDNNRFGFDATTEYIHQLMRSDR